MMFNESCKTGHLRVDTRSVKVVSGKRILWTTARSKITYIEIKQGVLFADLTIYTATSHFPAHAMAKQHVRQFLALFPGVPHGDPPVVAPPPTYAPPPMASGPQWNAAPTVPFQVSPPFQPTIQMTKKKIPVWAYVVSIILVLAFCGCVGSAVVDAISNNATQQAQVAPTPTHTPDTSQSLTLAATVTSDTPTSAPANTPTAKPTAEPTAKPTPKPVPTRPPVPTPTPKPSCNAINGNPWCYNFSPGNLIYTPPSGFCGYFNCIASFYSSDDPGDGYIIECQDGTYSQSGGERGACSSHGGEMRALYSH